MTIIYINGEFYPPETAKISVFDRGARFGDGLYETIAVYNTIPFLWEKHLERLNEGIKAIKLNADISDLRNICDEVLSKNNISDGLLRIAITRGEGSLGFLPTNETEAGVIVEAMSSIGVDEPVKLWLSKTKKTPIECLPVNVKTMQGLNSILARMEAKENDCFESLLLGIDDQICECSSSSIFWLKDDFLFTPSLESGILPGTTRAVVKEIAPYDIIEGIFPIEDLETADEVFITNVVWHILPICALLPNGLEWNRYEKTQRLQKLYQEYVDGYISKVA